MKALIVDDDIAVRMTLEMAFEGTGWQVATAGSGAEAQQRLARESFEVLILDKNLPDTTGVDLLRDQRSRGSRVRAFMMTGQADARSAAQTLELGIDGYYEKPFDNVYDVVKTICEVVERRSRSSPTDLAQASSHFKRSQAMLGRGETVAGAHVDRGLVLCLDPRESAALEAALRDLCGEVVNAVSPQQAIECMRGQRPELAVLDAQLASPRVTALVDQYRALVPHAVVLVLGRQQLGLESLKKLIDLGVDGLIDRPLDVAQLRDRLVQALRQSARRRID